MKCQDAGEQCLRQSNRGTPACRYISAPSLMAGVRLHVTLHEAPFDYEQHPLTRRWAVVEEDGEVAWLYLSAPDALKPVAACFLYNQADQAAPQPKNIHFRWSSDGESVAVYFESVLMGFIAGGEQRGFSKLLTAPGALGAPLDESLYERTFRAT